MGNPLIASWLLVFFLFFLLNELSHWPYCHLSVMHWSSSCFFFIQPVMSCILFLEICHTLLVGSKRLCCCSSEIYIYICISNLLILAAIIRCIFIWKWQSAIFCFPISIFIWYSWRSWARWCVLVQQSRLDPHWFFFAGEPTLAFMSVRTWIWSFCFLFFFPHSGSQEIDGLHFPAKRVGGRFYDCKIELLLFVILFTTFGLVQWPASSSQDSDTWAKQCEPEWLKPWCPPPSFSIQTAQLYRSVACRLRPDSAVILAGVDCLDAQWLPVHLTGLTAFTAPFRQIKVEQTLV